MTWYTWKGSLASGKLREIKGPNGQEASAQDNYVWDGWCSHLVGRDAFKDVDACRQKALAERDKKIASLEKQIKKLRAMTFEKVS